MCHLWPFQGWQSFVSSAVQTSGEFLAFALLPSGRSLCFALQSLLGLAMAELKESFLHSDWRKTLQRNAGRFSPGGLGQVIWFPPRSSSTASINSFSSWLLMFFNYAERSPTSHPSPAWDFSEFDGIIATLSPSPPNIPHQLTHFLKRF